jgi:phosphatidylserine decarboxylase
MVREVRKNPELLAAVDQAVRGELTEAMGRFELAAAENERAISAARTANERVLKAIVAAVNSRRSVGTYGNNGAIAEAPRPQRAQAMSIAIDRRF